MKKIFKILNSFFLITIGWLSNVFATEVEPSDLPPILYGPPEPMPKQIRVEKISNISILVLFIIGLFVVFNKKLSKKAKIITVSIIVIIVVLILFLKKL